MIKFNEVRVGDKVTLTNKKIPDFVVSFTVGYAGVEGVFPGYLVVIGAGPQYPTFSGEDWKVTSRVKALPSEPEIGSVVAEMLPWRGKGASSISVWVRAGNKWYMSGGTSEQDWETLVETFGDRGFVVLREGFGNE